MSPGNLYLSVYFTSPEFFFIDHNIFFPNLSYTVSQYFMTLALMAVRQEVNNLEISVVVQELEFTMNPSKALGPDELHPRLG